MKPVGRVAGGAVLCAGLVLGAAAAGAAPPAERLAPSAPLWGWVDGQGTAHFSSRPLDSRYQLVAPGPSAGADAFRAVPGKTDGPGALMTWLDIAPQVKAVQPWLREAARLHGVDVELLKAVIAVESGFDAKAVSPRGAMGLMQITADTADRYATPGEAQRPAAERLMDPRTNIHTGARMLGDLMRRLGRIDLALAAWNAGEGSVRRHGGMPPVDETRAHVHLVLELYWSLLQRSQTHRAERIQWR